MKCLSKIQEIGLILPRSLRVLLLGTLGLVHIGWVKLLQPEKDPWIPPVGNHNISELYWRWYVDVRLLSGSVSGIKFPSRELCFPTFAIQANRLLTRCWEWKKKTKAQLLHLLSGWTSDGDERLKSAGFCSYCNRHYHWYNVGRAASINSAERFAEGCPKVFACICSWRKMDGAN